jgi:hypothetical protein
MTNRVAATELAARVGWDPKRLRAWLRAAAADGHPLLRGHGPHDRWVFSPIEADVLERLILDVPQGPGSTVVEKLRELDPVPVPDLDPQALPERAGLYAWWCRPGSLPDVAQAPNGATINAGWELAYIGLAGSLRSRIATHLASDSRRSTLRRALGAWLGARLGWRTEVRAGRRVHTAETEAALTAWMGRNLALTWVAHPDPAEIEPEAIARLAPPLNHDQNRSHPNWTALDRVRRRWWNSAD